ncbi:NADP-dependent oxidoreductase [Nocardia sp. NPDC052566]|uniref:NADP-dependent oxidoreductase n=1 Tax=Nocardia sp. NPDC052566 TaxID=3364330 RepID=UPI0037C8792A
MLAITQKTFGGPEVLEIVDRDRPVPGPGDVLVRVAATSVNAADWKLRSGEIRKLGDPPFILGLDVSGVVEDVGAEVVRFAPGDAVFGMAFGANAQYVLAPVEALAPKPANLDHTVAAAMPAAALTAWQSLRDVWAGQRVLVHAAAGGVGHLAVQFAVHRGAHVVGTARAGNHEFLRGLGAHELIDYRTTDFTEVATDIDVVLDLVGGDYGSRSARVLRPTGRLIDFQGNDAEADPRYERFYVTPSGADLKEVAALVDHGLVRVDIDQVLPITEIVKAHRLSESGRVRGKIVLTADW